MDDEDEFLYGSSAAPPVSEPTISTQNANAPAHADSETRPPASEPLSAVTAQGEPDDSDGDEDSDESVRARFS